MGPTIDLIVFFFIIKSYILALNCYNPKVINDNFKINTDVVGV